MAKKIKGKEWYSVVAPKLFDNKVLGETPVDDIKKMKWRIISVPLINLTNDMSKYYFKIQFRIVDLNGKAANTEFAGLECLRDYISRMIRHGTNRIDTVQTLKTKNDKRFVVKTITITNKKIRRGLRKELISFIKKVVQRRADEMELDDFMTEVIDGSLKNEVMNDGSKIYPIRNFEVRKIEVPVKQ